jgi:3-hydroxy-9,10-secoandrosta-1,3,5(10)-triene-9,17-dione monooxygenase
MTSYENIPTGETMNEYGLESPRAKQMIEAARAMGPALRMRAAKAKADARVPDETVQEFHEVLRGGR